MRPNTCSILRLPPKLLFHQDGRGWKGTEQTGYKDSNQFHACAVTVENKMLSAGFANSPWGEGTDALSEESLDDVMRTETEDNRELGKNCCQSLSQAPGLKFNLNFVSLAVLGREREEGDGETGRERILCPDVYWVFYLNVSKCGQASMWSIGIDS